MLAATVVPDDEADLGAETACCRLSQQVLPAPGTGSCQQQDVGAFEVQP